MTREETLREAAAAVYSFPTSIGTLLEETRLFFRRYVVAEDVHYDTVALWIAHSHVFLTARATPYLHFWSPDPGSGKTTALEVIEVLGRDGMTVDNLTGPSLFRLIEAKRPTLLIDEVDGIFGKKMSDTAEDIRMVLNSGYRAGKRAIRMGGPQRDQIMMFDPYCPKALAGIRELPSTLAHRSIAIAMKPPRSDEHHEDFDIEELEEEAQQIRERLEAWAGSAQDVLRDPARKPAKLPGLDARRNQIWRILFRIAELAGGDWPERARTAAVELSSGDRRSDEASAGIKLLAGIRNVFADDKMSCKAITEALNALEDGPWGGWNDGAGIKTRELGWKMRPYGIVAKTVRMDDGTTPKGYDRAQFDDPWARYLPDTALTTDTTATTRSQSQKPAEKEPPQDDVVAVLEEAANPHEQSDVAVVSVVEPQSGGESTNEGDLEGLTDDEIAELGTIRFDQLEAKANGHFESREDREAAKVLRDKATREKIAKEDAERAERGRQLFADDPGAIRS